MTAERPAGEPERPAGRGEREPERETPAERRRRLAAVFGEVLPDTTSDEREDPRDQHGTEEWLRSQVPPHHG